MTSKFHHSGITRVVLNYYNELIKKQDCQIDFVVPNEIDEKFKNIFNNNETKYYIFSKKMRICFTPLYVLKLMRLIKNNKYDIFHVHGSSYLLGIELLAAKLAKVKVRIAHSHNVKTEHKLLHKIMKRIFEKNYTYAYACSDEAGKWLFGNKKFEIINNGMDVEKYRYNEIYRKNIREKLKIRDDELLLGHIGLFNDQKNQIFIIDVLKEVLKFNSKVKLIFVGDGQKKSQIEKIVNENNLDNNVIFYRS